MRNPSPFSGSGSVQPNAFPVAALAGLGATGLGALLGKHERPMLNPAMLAKLFGPETIAGETQQLYQLLMQSPAFTQMMSSAAMRGNQLSQNMQASMARNGTSDTPFGTFLGAAGRGYGSTLQRQGQSDLFMQALQAALGSLQSRQNLFGSAYMNQGPTFGRMIGSSLLAAGAQGLGGYLTPKR